MKDQPAFKRQERKAEKISKAEKVYNAIQKDKRRSEKSKKAVAASA